MAEQDNQPPEDKNKVGRPLAYKTVEDLQVAIDAYFAMCDPHLEEQLAESGIDQKGQTIFTKRKVMTAQKPYTMSGLARALGVDRRTILNYSKTEQYFPTMALARSRCEEYWEGRLDSPYSNGAKFNLHNNFDGWRERQELTGPDGAPLMPVSLDSDILARMQKGGAASPGTEADSTE